MKNLTIIICAFNEEKTVSRVVQACCHFNPGSEVIVIDDGSTDRTPEILKDLKNSVPFRYIRLSENKGKSYAMCHGIEIASGDIIMFFDADSYGIRREHFSNMLKPVLDGRAEMVLGHTSANFMNYKLTPFKSYTGERVLLKRDILPILDDLRDLRFGIETYINYYYQTHGKSIRYVHLEGLHTLTKFAKRSLKEATKDYFREGNEIATTILRNYLPIARITKETITNTGETIRLRFAAIQGNLNKRFQDFREKMNTW